MPHGVEARVSAKSTLCGLYVDGLEKHLLDTADTDAPTLMGVLVPLLLYADDAILMSESAAMLQKQSNAPASFCEQCQLTVNLSRTKVIFEAQHSRIQFFAEWCSRRENGQLIQVLGLCHQRIDIRDKTFDSSCQGGHVCYAAQMCASGYQGSNYAVQAIGHLGVTYSESCL